MQKAQNRAQAKQGFKSLLLMLSLFALGACGFHPIYGTRDDGNEVSAQLNDVTIGNIGDRQGQVLRNALIDRMYRGGRPKNPQYSLAVNLRETQEGIGLLPNATTSLTELNLYADYTFSDKTGKELFRATSHAVATYNQLQQEYGTLAASETARQRCIEEVSEQIVERLSLYFSEGTIITQPARLSPSSKSKPTP